MCYNTNILRKEGEYMATSSLTKDFEIRDKKAFEQFKKDIETKSNHDRTIVKSPSLEKGREKLKQFSFR